MARNRKNQSAAIRFGPAIKALLLCALIGGFGIGYVWQKEQINRLGRQKKEREIALGKLIRENEERRRMLAGMRNPEYLLSRIKEMKLDLVAPQPSQIWRLPEPLPPSVRDSEPRFAARDASPPGLQ